MYVCRAAPGGLDLAQQRGTSSRAVRATGHRAQIQGYAWDGQQHCFCLLLLLLLLLLLVCSRKINLQ
jgi:hypothetical protein